MSGLFFTRTILAFRLTTPWNLLWSELLGSAVSHIWPFLSTALLSLSIASHGVDNHDSLLGHPYFSWLLASQYLLSSTSFWFHICLRI